MSVMAGPLRAINLNSPYADEIKLVEYFGFLHEYDDVSSSFRRFCESTSILRGLWADVKSPFTYAACVAELIREVEDLRFAFWVFMIFSIHKSLKIKSKHDWSTHWAERVSFFTTTEVKNYNFPSNFNENILTGGADNHKQKLARRFSFLKYNNDTIDIKDSIERLGVKFGNQSLVIRFKQKLINAAGVGSQFVRNLTFGENINEDIDPVLFECELGPTTMGIFDPRLLEALEHEIGMYWLPCCFKSTKDQKQYYSENFDPVTNDERVKELIDKYKKIVFENDETTAKDDMNALMEIFADFKTIRKFRKDVLYPGVINAVKKMQNWLASRTNNNAHPISFSDAVSYSYGFKPSTPDELKNENYGPGTDIFECIQNYVSINDYLEKLKSNGCSEDTYEELKSYCVFAAGLK